MCRQRWDSVAALREIVVEQYGISEVVPGWEALLGLPYVGVRRVLALVNFLRDSGVELPWFTDWDAYIARSQVAALAGCRRAPAVVRALTADERMRARYLLQELSFHTHSLSTSITAAAADVTSETWAAQWQALKRPLDALTEDIRAGR